MRSAICEHKKVHPTITQKVKDDVHYGLDGKTNNQLEEMTSFMSSVDLYVHWPKTE